MRCSRLGDLSVVKTDLCSGHDAVDDGDSTNDGPCVAPTPGSCWQKELLLLPVILHRRVRRRL